MDGHDNRIKKLYYRLEKIYRIGGMANNAMHLTLNLVVNLSNGKITEAQGLANMPLRLPQTTSYLCLVEPIPPLARIYLHERNIGRTKMVLPDIFHHIV